MLRFLPGVVRGVLSVLLIVTNTVLHCMPLFIIAFLKLLLPLKIWIKLCDILLIGIAFSWVRCNTFLIWLMHKIDWDIQGLEGLDKKEWYLVVANHQSWVDIPVLQAVFAGRIPFLKFFLKKELIWVPILGVAWWALDFPFMKRYSKSFLETHPHLKGKDIEITKKACEKFKTIPVSVMNFVEGTRFTHEKYEKQASPFTYLLKPKAGGVAFVLGAMGDYLNSIINVTIVYPEGAQDFWSFLCGKITKIKVNIETMPITDKITGDYFNDLEYRAEFQEWVNNLWMEKDAKIARMLGNNGSQVDKAA